MTIPVVVNGNPATYPVAGLTPGSAILDYSGSAPGVALVVRSGPNTNARFRVGEAGAAPTPDTITSATSSAGAGQIILEFSAVDSLGAPRADCPFEVVVIADVTVAVDITQGEGIVLGTGTQRLCKGLTDGAGEFHVAIEGASSAAVVAIANTVSVTPGSLREEVLLP